MAVFGVVQISTKISVSAAEIKLDLKLSSQIETTESYNRVIAPRPLCLLLLLLLSGQTRISWSSRPCRSPSLAGAGRRAESGVESPSTPSSASH